MSDDKVFALNVVSGKVDEVPSHWLTHPTFGPNLRQKRTDKPIINLPDLEVKEPAETDVESAPSPIDKGKSK